MDDPKAAETAVDTAVGEVFDREYYATHCGGLPYDHSCGFWGEFFGKIADELVRAFRPRRVFDAGCAHGFLVEALWDRGVEAWGRDISRHANADVRQDVRQYCSIGSIADPIEGQYDLLTCIEVLEHMPEAEAIRAIAAMTSVTNRILFSSSPSDFDEPTHINVRPAIYWLRLFAANGFTPDMTYDATFILPHTLVLERAEATPREQDLTACANLVRMRILLAERDKANRALEAERARSDHELVIERARVNHELEIERARVNYELEIARGRIADELNTERARVQGGIEIERTQADRDLDLQQAQANHDQASLIRALCDLEAERVRGIAELEAERARGLVELEAELARSLAGREADHARNVAEKARVIAELVQRVAELEARYQAVVTSTLWLTTSPLRRMGQWLSQPTRRRLRRTLAFVRRSSRPRGGATG
jgi:2-polyprenyl-3-methyl-5-hydroxy-6-metoxy-1,4-benzoquinol methylase